MRFLHTVVSQLGLRQVASNPERLRLLDLLIAHAVDHGARLLVLPAGFLAAATTDAMLDLIRQVDEKAAQAAIAVVGGIDLDVVTTERPRSLDEAVRDGRLPFFAFAVGTVALSPECCLPWRQVSINNANSRFVAEEALPGESRVVVVDGFRIAVLVCGELFNCRARRNISQLHPHLVVDLGHAGMGCGLIRAMNRIATDSRCMVAHAQHLARDSGCIHLVTAEGKQDSVPATRNGLLRCGNLWVGWTPRELHAGAV